MAGNLSAKECKELLEAINKADKRLGRAKSDLLGYKGRAAVAVKIQENINKSIAPMKDVLQPPATQPTS